MCGHNHPTMIQIHSFFITQKPKQSQLSSHFDFGVNNLQRTLHPQYHDWGETLVQDTEPPTVARAPRQYGCPLLWVSVHGVCECSRCVCALGWVKCRAQIPSMGHHIWPHVTSLHVHFSFMSGRANHFTPDCFLNEGQFKAGFVKKLILKDDQYPLFMIQLHLQK